MLTAFRLGLTVGRKDQLGLPGKFLTRTPNRFMIWIEHVQYMYSQH